MTKATFRQHAGQQEYTAGGSAVAAGTIVELGNGRAGVVKADLEPHQLGAVYTAGIFDLPCAAATEYTAGAVVDWDADPGIDVAAGAGDLRVGTAVLAVDDAGEVVRVDLNTLSMADVDAAIAAI